MSRSGGKFYSQIRQKDTLDGPGGFQRYSHDEDIPPENFSTRHSGGGSSIVIWGAFLYSGSMELQVVQGRQNAAEYIGSSQKGLIRVEIEDLIFQQDNAAIQTAHRLKDFFLC